MRRKKLKINKKLPHNQLQEHLVLGFLFIYFFFFWLSRDVKLKVKKKHENTSQGKFHRSQTDIHKRQKEDYTQPQGPRQQQSLRVSIFLQVVRATNIIKYIASS